MTTIRLVRSKATTMFCYSKRRISFWRITKSYTRAVRDSISSDDSRWNPSVHLDMKVNSPFESLTFIEQMSTVLRNGHCSITPECQLEGKGDFSIAFRRYPLKLLQIYFRPSTGFSAMFLINPCAKSIDLPVDRTSPPSMCRISLKCIIFAPYQFFTFK